jgi:hypothetical protein
MKNQPQKLELEHHLPVLALLSAAILGLYVRLNPVLQSDFPLNDGSLFVLMSEELIRGGFRLPKFTGYNLSQIPFAYPPLGFYLAALIARISGWEMLSIFRFLPALLSWLTIPAFYLAAKRLLKSAAAVSIAVIVFALVPRSWLWLIMGGGLTRSLGLIFSILSIYFGHRLFTEHKGLLHTILCYTLAVLSHPEALIFAALALVLLYLVYDRSLTGFRDLVLVGGGALLLSAPWWLTVILRHGVEPFLAASHTSGLSLTFILRMLVFNLTGEPTPAVFATLTVIGVFFTLYNKHWFLPALAIATLVFIPRSGPNYLTVPLAMLAALAISDVLLPALSLKNTLSLAGKILLGYLLVNLFISAALAPTIEETAFRAIAPDERQVMTWVAEHTDPDSQFLLLTGADWWNDPTAEWFPYLTGRHSLNTLQGAEWLPDAQFNQALTWNTVAQRCLEESAACLKQVRNEYRIPFTHLFIPRQTEDNPFSDTHAIEISLQHDPDFVLLFETPGAAVYRFAPGENDKP